AAALGLTCVSACGEDLLDAGWTAVSAGSLDAARGGFETADGLRVAFAIDRTTYVNGELVASSHVFIPDVGHVTHEQAEAFRAASKILLVQNGPNGRFEVPDLDLTGLAAGSTVIQNTLNDQRIVTNTTLTASVNTLALFQGLNLHDSLQQALDRVAGPR
ncbi:MAG TPA: hypothetical protein VNQ81_04140, partial [Povalibacter sp.]|nr:hypothetical protein [Povalibacter sp.]